MAKAFQTNAFQNNAFQVDGVTPPIAITGDAAAIFVRRQRRPSERLSVREWWRLILGRNLPDEFNPPAVVEYDDEAFDILMML